MEQKNNCNKCSVEFKSSDVIISCNGACENKYHAKCFKLNAAGVKIYKDCLNIKILCDECLKDPVNTLNETMKKILLCIIDERLSRQDRNLERINEAIEKFDESETD